MPTEASAGHEADPRGPSQGDGVLCGAPLSKSSMVRPQEEYAVPVYSYRGLLQSCQGSPIRAL